MIVHRLNRPHFVYLSIRPWTHGLFHLSAIVNNAALNISVLTSAHVSTFHSLADMPRGGIAGSYGNSMFSF